MGGVGGLVGKRFRRSVALAGVGERGRFGQGALEVFLLAFERVVSLRRGIRI